jgi:hypothetical protein
MKMKKIYVTGIAAALTAVALMYACKRTEAAPEESNPVRLKSIEALQPGQALISVENGWLNFPSMKSFNAIMEELHGKYEDVRGIANWEQAYKGYTSLRKQYELIDADTSENRRLPTTDSLIRSNKILYCPDTRFATVLNKDGYIQIADTIYSFRPGVKSQEGYAVPSKYAQQLVRGAAPLTIPGAKLHRISFEMLQFPQWQWPDEWHVPDHDPIVIPNLPICQYPSGNMPNWWGQSGGDIYEGNDGDNFPEHNGRTVKLNFHRWRVGYIFYASAGIRLKMLKHTRFAGWQSVTYADEMVMDACCKGNVFIPGLPLIGFNEQVSPGWPNFARYAENSFEKTMKWTASGVFNEIILEHFNFHFRVNYRGRIAERYIRQ